MTSLNLCVLLLEKQAQVKMSIVVTVPVPKAFMVSIDL